MSLTNNYGSQLRKEREALDACIRMRKNVEAAKDDKSGLGFILILAASSLLSFQFRAELANFALQLHGFCTGKQSCITDAVKTESASTKPREQAKSHHAPSRHKEHVSHRTGRHTHNA